MLVLKNKSLINDTSLSLFKTAKRLIGIVNRLNPCHIIPVGVGRKGQGGLLQNTLETSIFIRYL